MIDIAFISSIYYKELLEVFDWLVASVNNVSYFYLFLSAFPILILTEQCPCSIFRSQKFS